MREQKLRSMLMTRQIVIKLNEKRFKPLLEGVICASSNIINNYSECIGKLIFFAYDYLFTKYHRLGNKTKHEFILAALGISEDEETLKFLGDYNQFIKR